MATRRFNYKDDWVLKDGNIGINTETPSDKFDTSNELNYTNLEVTGIATLTNYEGFSNQKVSYDDKVIIDSGDSGTLSSEIIVGVGQTLVVSTGATISQGSIKSLKVNNTFNPPIGGTNERPSAPKKGVLFYNKDFKTIEYWDGNFWRQVDNVKRNGRAIFFGGYNTNPHGAAYGKHIDYLNLSSGGNAISFGDLDVKRTNALACGNAVRSLCTRGYSDGEEISYVTIASTGNGMDFGDATVDTYGGQGVSSSTRGIFVGGAGTNIIDYVEIMTTGNAQDFGDAGVRSYYRAAMQSPVRAVLAGGYGNYGEQMAYNSGMISFIMSSKGNSYGWGDTTDAGHDNVNGGSNHVRGVYALGAMSESPYGMEAAIDYTTLATGGNAISFGDLTHAVNRPGSSASNIRVVIAGGRNTSNSTKYTEIDSILIASTGGGTSFGDLMVARDQFGGTSDCHGGLGGF